MDFIHIGDFYVKTDLFCQELTHFETIVWEKKSYIKFYFKTNSTIDLKCILSNRFDSEDNINKWMETYLIPTYQQGIALLKKDKIELTERVEVLEDSLKFLCGGKEYQQAKEDFEEKVEKK